MSELKIGCEAHVPVQSEIILKSSSVYERPVSLPVVQSSFNESESQRGLTDSQCDRANQIKDLKAHDIICLCVMSVCYMLSV